MEIFLRASTLGELSALENAHLDGVVFGAEFCPFKLPKPDEVRAARALCQQNGLKFSLSTPLARATHFGLVTGWLEESLLEGEEWTANDWGLLFWAKEKGLKNPVNAGRLLGKQRRDPRVLQMMEDASVDEKRALQGSLWDDEADVELARGLAVVGFELDCLLQGVARPPIGDSPLILCGPHIPVTLALACPWNEKMLRSPESCPVICRNFPEAKILTDQRPEPLLCSGNAQFVDCGDVLARETAAEAKAARLVLSAAIPA